METVLSGRLMDHKKASVDGDLNGEKDQQQCFTGLEAGLRGEADTKPYPS